MTPQKNHQSSGRQRSTHAATIRGCGQTAEGLERKRNELARLVGELLAAYWLASEQAREKPPEGQSGTGHSVEQVS